MTVARPVERLLPLCLIWLLNPRPAAGAAAGAAWIFALAISLSVFVT